jgi:hypothetical protein
MHMGGQPKSVRNQWVVVSYVKCFRDNRPNTSSRDAISWENREVGHTRFYTFHHYQVIIVSTDESSTLNLMARSIRLQVVPRLRKWFLSEKKLGNCGGLLRHQ